MKLLLASLLATSSVVSFAQTSASLTEVQGNISITSGGTTSKGVKGSALKNDDIVAVSSGSSGTAQVGSCIIDLKSGQSLTVDTKSTCAVLLGSVKTITVPSASFTSGIPGGPVGLGLGLVAGGLVINELTKKEEATKVVAATPTPTPTPTPAPAPAPSPVAQPPKASGA